MEIDNIRIDKYLWNVRIFKTRSLASNACKKDKIFVNGISTKSSKSIKINDIIEVKKNPVLYKYRVKGIPKKRLGAKLVGDYLEELTSEEEKMKLDVMNKNPFGQRRKGFGRPTKKERRIIDQLNNLNDN